MEVVKTWIVDYHFAEFGGFKTKALLYLTDTEDFYINYTVDGATHLTKISKERAVFIRDKYKPPKPGFISSAMSDF